MRTVTLTFPGVSNQPLPLTHGVIIGATTSGKSHLLKMLAEQVGKQQGAYWLYEPQSAEQALGMWEGIERRVEEIEQDTTGKFQATALFVGLDGWQYWSSLWDKQRQWPAISEHRMLELLRRAKKVNVFVWITAQTAWTGTLRLHLPHVMNSSLLPTVLANYHPATVLPEWMHNVARYSGEPLQNAWHLLHHDGSQLHAYS